MGTPFDSLITFIEEKKAQTAGSGLSLYSRLYGQNRGVEIEIDRGSETVSQVTDSFFTSAAEIRQSVREVIFHSLEAAVGQDRAGG